MDSDLPLIQALQAGDDSALNELIHRHREPLFYFVFRYLRDATAARDVVQETFVRTYFKAGKFRPSATVKTWIYTIALNLCRDHARCIGKRRNDISLDETPSPERSPLQLADSRPIPSDETAQKDRFARLQHAIAQLPNSLREALILFSLEGKSQQEAAAILGTTPKTIELRVYHAKDKLRKLLGDLLR